MPLIENPDGQCPEQWVVAADIESRPIEIEARMSPEEIHALKEKLARADCEPELRAAIERLIADAEKLRADLDDTECDGK